LHPRNRTPLRTQCGKNIVRIVQIVQVGKINAFSMDDEISIWAVDVET